VQIIRIMNSQQQKRPEQGRKVPDFPITIRVDDNPLRKKDSRFLCNVRFKNDLPEIPSDPKMLLPQLDLTEVGAFKLFGIERHVRRDVKFPADMNLPLSSLYIEQYDVYSGDKLHPKDAALLDETGDAVVGSEGASAGRKRKNIPNASWLMRTKYISNESGAVGLRKQNGSAASAEFEHTLEDQVAHIEESFDAMKSKPVHPKNPSLVAVDVQPVLPDDEISDWPLVLVNFDSDPIGAMALQDADAMAAKRKFAQSMHLKTLVKQDDDGNGEKFNVLMAPREVDGLESIADDQNVPGSMLQGDYDWMRTYASNVRIDDKAQTFLFRIKGDHIGYSDLSTKLFLRKRKKTVSKDEKDDIESLKPEKFVLSSS
jgi:RNA polymerase II-associated factor 1